MGKYQVQGSLLEAVSKHTAVSFDSMFSDTIEEFEPFKFLNATSNQGIVYAYLSRHPELVSQAEAEVAKFADLSYGELSKEDKVQEVIYHVTALIGAKMLPKVQGCVLSQTLPKFYRDTQETVQSALRYVQAYERIGIDRRNVIIKVPISWESAQACKILTDTHKVQTLGTVIHSVEQGIITAESGCVACSPYVDELQLALDPSLLKEYPTLEDNYGYRMTRELHYYYRSHSVKTRLVIAALIGMDTLKALVGVDEMTIPIYTLDRMAVERCDDIEAPLSVMPSKVPEKVSYIDNKASYDSKLASNPVALERIEYAIKTFSGFDTLTRELVEQRLNLA